MVTQTRPCAVVTGAPAGIGFHLARECAEHGYDLLITSDQGEIKDAADRLRRAGTNIEAFEGDLADRAGVEKLYAATKGRSVDLLLANAGRGLGRAFLDQEPAAPFDPLTNRLCGRSWFQPGPWIKSS